MRAKVRRRRSTGPPPAAGLARAQGMVYGAPGLAAAQGLAYAPFGVPPAPTPVFGGGKVDVPGLPGNGSTPVTHFPGWMSDAQIRAQAAKEAALALGPQRAELLRAKLADQQAAAAQARSQQGFALAGANLVKGIGGQVSGAYSTAAKDTATFAKGYSDGLAHVQSQSAQDANATIAAAGGGPGQMLQGDRGAANVLFGLGGYIPATTLEREGAAFGAAALRAPAVVLGQGRADAAKTFADQRKRSAEYDAKMGDLSVSQRGIIEKAIYDTKRDQLSLKQYDDQQKFVLRQYEDNRNDAKTAGAIAAATAEWERNFKVAGLEQANRIAAATLGLNYEKLSLENRVALANLLGVDAPTGLPTLEATTKTAEINLKTERLRLDTAIAKAKDATTRQKLVNERIALDTKQSNFISTYNLNLDKFGLDQDTLKLKAVELQWKMQHPPKKGGFTASQLAKLRGKAAKDARFFAEGGIRDEWRPGANGKREFVSVQYEPLSYQEAFQNLVEDGTPPEMAYNWLNKYYPEGERPFTAPAGSRNPLKINWGAVNAITGK